MGSWELKVVRYKCDECGHLQDSISTGPTQPARPQGWGYRSRRGSGYTAYREDLCGDCYDKHQRLIEDHDHIATALPEVGQASYRV